MNEFDLAALVPDIDTCINAYEMACRKAIAKSQPEQIEPYAVSLHFSPIMQALFTLNVTDSASMTQEEIYNEHAQHIPEAEINSNEINKQDDLKKQFYFDWECETVDPQSEYYSLIKPNYGKDSTLKGPILMKPRKITFESNLLKDLNNYYAKNFDLNKSAENCFNCDLSFKLETTYPGIEMAWVFDKILKEISLFISAVKRNIDPAGIYNQLCNLKMFVGKNYMCPANMLNLQLMLPALFMKYSIDLGNLSVDANWLLGGLIKAIFATIAAFLENLRSLIMPFLNCYIDGINTTFGYIKSVVRSISRSVDSVADSLERMTGAITKTAAQIFDIFNTTDSEEAESRIQGIEGDIKRYERSYELLLERLDAQYDSLDEKRLWLDQIETSMHRLKQIISEKTVISYILRNERKYLRSGETILTYEDFRSLFIEYYLGDTVKSNTTFREDYFSHFEEDRVAKNVFYLIEYLKTAKEDVEKKEKKARDKIYKTRKEMGDKKRSISSKEEQMKTQREVIEAKGKESIFERMSIANTFVNNTKFFAAPQPGPSLKTTPTPRYKTGSSLHSMGVDFNKFALGPWAKVESFLTQRYGIKTSNQYMKTEYFKSFREKTKQYEKKSTDALEEVRRILVKPAEVLKTFINDFIGNVINALHNLRILLDQGAMAEIKILGEILQLTHIIRLIRVIIKMAEEGLGGCDDIANSKEKKDQLKEIIEDVNPDLKMDFYDENSEELKSEKTFAKIYAKNSNYAHLLNAKDCSELSFHTEKKSNNLDSIYDSLKEALI